MTADMDEKDMPGDKDMSDHDKVMKADVPKHVDPLVAGRSSDWTASDARGPLVTAPDGTTSFPQDPDPVHDAGGEAIRSDAPPHQDPPAAEPSATDTPVAPAVADTTASAEGSPRKRSLWPVAAGVVIGAVIGAGSAAIVYSQFGSTPPADPQVASLGARVDALERQREPQAEAVGTLQSTIADLGAKVAALEQRSPAAAPAAAAPTPLPAVDLTPLEQKIAALQAGLDALKAAGADSKGIEAKIAALQGDVAGAKTATTTTQASIASVAGQQKLLADKVMVPGLAVVAGSLIQQIDQGQPYTAQVDALAALGADPAKIAILRQNADKGVPSANMLAAQFEPLAEPIVATAHKPPPNAGLVDRLKSGMFSMVSIRSVDDTSGTDLPSRVAKIEADLAHDDIVDALATWDALPPEAKAKGDAWSALAKTSADAMTAARALQHESIVALGAKKS